MTEAQGDAVLAQLTTLIEHVERLDFLNQVTSLVLCFIWGAITWRLIVLAKNQPRFWGLFVALSLSFGAGQAWANCAACGAGASQNCGCQEFVPNTMYVYGTGFTQSPGNEWIDPWIEGEHTVCSSGGCTWTGTSGAVTIQLQWFAGIWQVLYSVSSIQKLLYYTEDCDPCNATYTLQATFDPGNFDGPPTVESYFDEECPGGCEWDDPCDGCGDTIDCEDPQCEGCPACDGPDCEACVLEGCQMPACYECQECMCEACVYDGCPPGCEGCPGCEEPCGGDCDEPCWQTWEGNPWDNDSDGDGIPDYRDPDPYTPGLGYIVRNFPVERQEFEPEWSGMHYEGNLPSLGTDNQLMVFPIPIPGLATQQFLVGTDPTAVMDTPVTQAIVSLRGLMRLFMQVCFSFVFAAKIWLAIRQY